MDKEIIKSEFNNMFPDALYSQRTKAIEFAEHIAAIARKEDIEEYDGKAAGYEEVLRTLAAYVGNGGYNAESPISADVFLAKIMGVIESMAKVQVHIARKQALKEVINIIPGGSVVDPQVICDEIRELMAKEGTN